MKITLKETYKLCAELWRWLEQHPEKYKVDWPGWKLHGKVRFDCFACEYIKQYNVTCRKCPLLELWPNLCTWSQSPFFLWGKGVDKAKQASIIADYCEQKLRGTRPRHEDDEAAGGEK